MTQLLERMREEFVRRKYWKSGSWRCAPVVQHVASIRILYCKTMKRRDMKDDLPYSRNYRRRLPVILSREEATRVIDPAGNLYHRAILMILYCCGLRRK